MKYPINQFNILVEVLKTLRNQLDLTKINPSALHYIVYEQFSTSHKHNWLFCYNGAMKKYHQLTEVEKVEAVKFVNTGSQTFELYPEGCNDTHVETAVKKAVKILYN